MKQAGMEMLGATQGVEGPPCSTPAFLETLLEMFRLHHYPEGCPFALYFSWGNWADNTKSEKKGITGGRRNLRRNENERKQTKQSPHKGGKDKSGGEFNWCDTDHIQRSTGWPGHAAWRLPPPQGLPCPFPRDTHPQIQTGQRPRERLRGSWGGKQKGAEHRPEALPCSFG